MCFGVHSKGSIIFPGAAEFWLEDPEKKLEQLPILFLCGSDYICTVLLCGSKYIYTNIQYTLYT